MMMKSNQLISLIKKHQVFLLSTHQNPDPDALCSELACAHFLKALGKTVKIINAEKFPPRFSFLPNKSWIQSFRKGEKVSYDAAIILDCGDFDRIDYVKALIDRKKPIINIDHHVTNTNFGTFNFVNPKAASTTEVLYDLIKSAGVKLNDQMAYHLYAGIMTDTGSFRYENTTPQTHQIAAYLCGYKISADKIYKDIYDSIPAQDLKMAAQIIGNMDLMYDGKAIILELYKKDIAKFSKELDLRDVLFKFLRMIKGVEVVIIFTEVNKKQTRANFRSSRYVDVAQLASLFGGGGHRRASGCMMNDSIKVFRQKVQNYLKKVI